MHLTSIKLSGFKSFVDPTKIPIRSHMTAIVGPNGCGKSNIVDAIRWVIGESSAKQLRGQSMSDVIFNGTTQRKPVGRASVELHFDNSLGRITGEYAAYTDLVIRREVERDGQSQYFLNGAHCRRRDILDIFLGTGLGSRSYSIIEQGMISELIEAKPEEMRAHLEEVAGISKYKERRRETENRIQHTRENLDRLNDIRAELDKQLRHLKRQANAAERYKAFKEEERALVAQIKALHWQALEKKRELQQEKLNRQLLQREQALAEQRQFEANIDKVKLSQEELQETHQVVQKQYYQVGEEIARLEQQIKHQQEQMQRWQQELTNTENLWKELEETSVEHHLQVEEIEAEVADLTPQKEEASSQVTFLNQALVEANARMQTWQRQWDNYQQELSQVNSQTQVTSTKIEHHNQQTQQFNERRQRVNTRYQQLRINELEAEIQQLQMEVESLQTQLTASQNDLQTTQQKIADQRQINKQLQISLQTKQREWQSLEAEQTKISALQQAALGCNDQGSIRWLTQNQLNNQRRLGQEIKVDHGWEKAVEIVMSHFFEGICVEEIKNYIDSLTQLNDGRITLIEKGQNPSGSTQKNSSFETLQSKIQSDWALGYWLQGIYVAETLPQAQEMQSHLADYESILTRDGIWLGKNWIRVSQLPDPKQGILEREKTLQRLHAELTLIGSQRDEVEQQLKQGEAELYALERHRDQQQQIYQKESTQFTSLRSQLSARSAQLENLHQEESRLQSELEDIHRRLQENEQQLNELLNRQENFKSQQGDFQNKREQLIAEREKCQRQLEQSREAFHRQQNLAEELTIRLSTNENQLSLLRHTIQRNEKQLQQFSERREFLQQNLATASSLEEQQADLQERLAQRLLMEKTVNVSENKVNELRQQLKEWETAKNRIIENVNVLQSEIEQLRMEGQEILVRQQTIKEQLQETQNELVDILTTLGPESELSVWEERLQHLQQQIERLGPINLAAIDEHQTSTERKEYLDKQFQDLTESLETLEAAIQKIDRESKTRFRETFDKVNQTFQEIFPKIFGGGRATLELSENDLLKTGIIVKAQPPGKRNSTIHMLSGGEKALTAISLVFSLFQLNPAPFCILDEVDAPLDDLNVGRFCQLVKAMSQETQFLIVSHNKVTIEMANHLMGVTMQEPGVSRLVAVDVAEALEMVESAA